jgi:hypothetical protein
MPKILKKAPWRGSNQVRANIPYNSLLISKKNTISPTDNNNTYLNERRLASKPEIKPTVIVMKTTLNSDSLDFNI